MQEILRPAAGLTCAIVATIPPTIDNRIGIAVARGRGDMRFRKIICAFAISGALLGGTAIAEESQAGLVMAVPLGSKTLAILRGSNNFDCDHCQATATIDGQVVAVDASVKPRRLYGDAEVDAVVLELNNLGNGGGCVTQYAIAWVTKLGEIGATDPFYDHCYEDPDIIVVPGEITVRFAPSIRRDGLVYRWTLKNGLAPPIIEKFSPDLNKDWDWLGFGFDGWDIFENAAVYEAFKTILGSDFDRFRTCFDRGSDLKVLGDGMVIGAADGDYTARQTVFAVDPEQKPVFVALRLEDRRWRFFPDRSEWPNALRASIADEFPQWASPFESKD